jgi:hypothetical protein
LNAATTRLDKLAAGKQPGEIAGTLPPADRVARKTRLLTRLLEPRFMQNPTPQFHEPSASRESAAASNAGEAVRSNFRNITKTLFFS